MIFGILLVIVLMGTLYVISKNNKKIRQLKHDYETALKGNDKDAALKKGREYYSALRRAKQLTALDELELSKTIDAMK
jgi:hypothetical protein